MRYLGMFAVMLIVGFVVAVITNELGLPPLVAGIPGAIAMLGAADLYLRFTAHRNAR